MEYMGGGAKRSISWAPKKKKLYKHFEIIIIILFFLTLTLNVIHAFYILCTLYKIV